MSGEDVCASLTSKRRRSSDLHSLLQPCPAVAGTPLNAPTALGFTPRDPALGPWWCSFTVSGYPPTSGT